MSLSQKDTHLLLRLGFLPRGWAARRLSKLGREAFVEEQLHPERLPEDPEVDRGLEALKLLDLPPRELARLEDGEERAYYRLLQRHLLLQSRSRRRLAARVEAFWVNHFYVPAEAAGVWLAHYHRSLARHSLGRFRDLLFVSARHPAMLVYLNADGNVKEHPNENYARELLELHTLGVDGGYSERDVKEAARALTGWTTHPRSEDGFYFDPEAHDDGPKRILGHAFPAGRGIADGLQLLDLAARHPATARFVARKLSQWFVSDDPPAGLIERLAGVFQRGRGRIRPVLRELFGAPEFYAAAGRRLRTPLEFLTAAMEATGTVFTDEWRLRDTLNRLGQPYLGWKTPDGYPTQARAWSGTSGLLARWQVALELTQEADGDPDGGWGLLARLERRTPAAATVGAWVRTAALEVWGYEPAPGRLAALVDYASDGAGTDRALTPTLAGRKRAGLFALLLSAPEFQWI
ncbi:DUF1800 domain-containing protein [Oceanithermus desulfurans]